VTNFYYSRM